ncbi:MAG: prepilin-type N-terminal cleavage/methylation domain-containing protein [bacterium]
MSATNRISDGRLPGPGGFTLIEILIVMGLMGVFVALILPDFNRVIPEMKVDKVASKMANDIRMSRTEAVSEMSYVWFLMSSSANAYTTQVSTRDATYPWDFDGEPVEDPLKSGAPLYVDLDEVDAFRGVRISGYNYSYVVFDALGSQIWPGEDVTITLQSIQTGYSRKLRVKYPLGRVEVLP